MNDSCFTPYLPDFIRLLPTGWKVGTVDWSQQLREKPVPPMAFIEYEAVPPWQGGQSLRIHIQSIDGTIQPFPEIVAMAFAVNKIVYQVECVSTKEDYSCVVHCTSIGYDD